MPPRNRIRTFCYFCNKEIEKIPSQIRDKNYCSISCASKAPRTLRNSVKVKCTYCRKIFLKPKSHLRKDSKNFCSTVCKGMSSRNRQKIECQNCGKVIERVNSRVQYTKGKNFCSKSCKTFKAYENGELIKTPEQIKKQSNSLKERFKDPTFKQLNSEKVKKAWQNGAYTGVHLQNSKMEIQLKPFLEKLGFKSAIDNTKRVICKDRTRIPDFYNEETNEIIEIFGIWWHRDNPNIDHESEEYVIERYAEIGWECKVIWEDEFKEYLLSLVGIT